MVLVKWSRHTTFTLVLVDSKKLNVYFYVNRKKELSQKFVMSQIANTFPIGGCLFHIDV